MILKYKYLEFIEDDGWAVYNHVTNEYLGYVEYGKRWKQWESNLLVDVGFTERCHLDMAHFLHQLNKEENPE